MAAIFHTQPGAAVMIPTSGSSPLTVSLDGWGGFQGFKSIITGASVSSQGNVQFMHTLRDFIYVYVFGERIGQATIHGIAFAGGCNGGGSGPESVLGYYNDNSISKTGQPLTIQIGTGQAGTIKGFLVGMQLDLTDPKLQLSQFSLKFAKFPPGV